MILSNVLPPSSGLKSKPNKLGLLLNPEDGGSKFLQNTGELLLNHMVSPEDSTLHTTIPLNHSHP
jgi:hypothetical protein